jgi:hypothetical protein
MAVESAKYFWVACDAEDCLIRTPPEEADVTAWSDADDAQTSALMSDFVHTDDGRWLCWDHTPTEEPEDGGRS